MKKLVLLLFLSIVCVPLVAQITAPDFAADDCDGNFHTLYTDLDQGKIIVLCWVEPCGGCIGPSLTAYNVVQSYASSNILFYLLDDFGDTPCSIVSGWAANNNIGPNLTTFSHSHILEANYGGIGMPHVVVIGTDRTIYFNELNQAAGNAPAIQNALNAALAAIGIEPAPQYEFSISLLKNPSSDKVTIRYCLSETTAVSVQVVNAFGKKISFYSLGAQAQGKNEFEIDLKRLAAGAYFILFDAGKHSRVLKMLVSH